MAQLRETEKQFQSAVMQLARLTGWCFYHTHDSRRSGSGFPDLCLVRNHRCIMAELKTDTGKVTADQELWLAALGAVEGIEAACWRPKDWGTIETTLRKRKTPDVSLSKHVRGHY